MLSAQSIGRSKYGGGSRCIGKIHGGGSMPSIFDGNDSSSANDRVEALNNKLNDKITAPRQRI